MAKVTIVFSVLFAIALGQTERWVYHYPGSGGRTDRAVGIACSADSSIYAAGSTHNDQSGNDFTVVGLTRGGSQRWVYRYNGTGDSTDGAGSTVIGPDGNIYAAGYSYSSSTGFDFTVISLTPTDSERWVYNYRGQGRSIDAARSLACGSDGNIYAAGHSTGSDTLGGFTVVSLTATGGERWVYRYHYGMGDSADIANSIIVGADGNIYAAGYSVGSDTGLDLVVISLTPGGGRRWVYRYNGPGNCYDLANELAYGADGNIYVAGASQDSSNSRDFVVLSLTSSGAERWVYRRTAQRNTFDESYSVVFGGDGNVYAAGTRFRGPQGYQYDFTVVSLTPAGSERWTYRNTGPGDGDDAASALVWGEDGNIYAAGSSCGWLPFGDFAVISLTSSGGERWVYRYDGPAGYWDQAYALVHGADGEVYAAGYRSPVETSSDFTVISLDPVPGIAEAGSRTRNNVFGLAVGTIQQRSLAYTLKLPEPATVSLSLYDLQGRKLSSWQILAPKGATQHTTDLPALSPGVYFLNAEVLREGLRGSRKLIVAR